MQASRSADDGRDAKKPRVDRRSDVFLIPSMRDLMTSDKHRISKPVQVGGFSKHPDDHVTFDRSLLKTLRKGAPLNADLLEGIDTYVEPPNSAPLEHVIAATLPAHRRVHDQALHTPPLLSKHHIVTYRNNLNKIMGTPYNTNSPYSMQMQRIQGCVYLNVVLSESSAPPSSAQNKGAYAGRRYEEVSSESSCPQGGEYCGVFSVSLGQKKLLIGAELDGVDAAAAAAPYVELKTFRVLATSKDRFTFERYKLLAFWIQSYMVGVPLIRVGFRSDSFHLAKEQSFKTTALPQYGDKYWNPSVCLNFTNMFLNWLLDQAVDEGVVYSVAYDPRSKCIKVVPSTASVFVRTPLATEEAAVTQTTI